MIETEPNRTSTATCITAYYLILSLYLAASFFPNLRVWGISQWAHLPIAVPITLFAVGSIIPIVLTRLLKNDRTEPGPRLSAAVMAATIVIFSLSFFLLRTKTHFLGDGYGLLSLLASGHQTIMISHELGESLAHVAMSQSGALAIARCVGLFTRCDTGVASRAVLMAPLNQLTAAFRSQYVSEIISFSSHI